MPINVSFLQDLLTTVAEQGRQYLPSALIGSQREDIAGLAHALLSGRGEASGVAIARQLLDHYRALGQDDRKAFFRTVAEDFNPNPEDVRRAARAYVETPSDAAMQQLRDAVESPRQEFFRRLNLAPGATGEIVAMRRDLLRLMKGEPGFGAVDDDMAHLFASWFNRGFLVLRRIDWQTPAAILEKIIRYEAVHEIQGWEDLRRRLEPADDLPGQLAELLRGRLARRVLEDRLAVDGRLAVLDGAADHRLEDELLAELLHQHGVDVGVELGPGVDISQ